MREAKQCKKVVVLDLDMRVVGIYDSLHLAAASLGVSRYKVTHRCNNGFKDGDEFYYFYYEDYLKCYNVKNA